MRPDRGPTLTHPAAAIWEDDYSTQSKAHFVPIYSLLDKKLGRKKLPMKSSIKLTYLLGGTLSVGLTVDFLSQLTGHSTCESR